MNQAVAAISIWKADGRFVRKGGEPHQNGRSNDDFNQYEVHNPNFELPFVVFIHADCDDEQAHDTADHAVNHVAQILSGLLKLKDKQS